MIPTQTSVLPRIQSDDRLTSTQMREWNPFPGHPTELVALRREQALHARPDRLMESPSCPMGEQDMNAMADSIREQPIRTRRAPRVTPAWAAVPALLIALPASGIGALARGLARRLPHLWAAAWPEIAPACRDPGFSTRPMEEPLDHALLREPWLGWWS